jgi:hypothetical protein
VTIGLPRGVPVGWGVSEALEAFVTSLPRISSARDDLRQPLLLPHFRDVKRVRKTIISAPHPVSSAFDAKSGMNRAR